VPRFKSFPRTTFSKWQFSIGLIAFFIRFFKLNIKFEAKYDREHEKNSIFLHQALHSSQIYNFTLNHDYKFKTIIV